MITTQFADRDAWLANRRGKITGSRLKDIVVKRGTAKKIGFYELIAERLGLPPDGENAMERGSRLEPVAIAEFEKITGKKVDRSLVIWSREDNESIAISPDGFIGDTEAVEAKVLSSARHIEALLTQKVPSEHEMQALQYFVVNDALQVLHFCFYDPRVLASPFFTIEVKREDVQAEVEKYLDYQRATLAEVDEIVLKLSNF